MTDDELDRLITKIFEICEMHGGDYQVAQLRELLTPYVRPQVADATLVHPVPHGEIPGWNPE